MLTLAVNKIAKARTPPKKKQKGKPAQKVFAQGGEIEQTAALAGRRASPAGAAPSKSEIVRAKTIELLPAECMRRPLLNHTRPGELVYDPFMGSGTTLIAAQSVQRRACGLEINPAYVDIAIRWQAYTGERARLVAADSPFHPLGESPAFEEVAQWRKTN